jgi:glycosyltransferase involved in cell wall biosynthesis
MVYSEGVGRDETVCRNFYELTEKDLQWVYPFSILQNLLGRYRTSRKRGDIYLHTNDKRKKRYFVKAILSSFLRFILGDEVPKKCFLSSDLEEWIKDFNPQIIYSAVGKSVFYVDLTLEIKGRFKIPVVIHIMDDWQSMKYRRGLFGPYLRSRLKRRLDKLLKVSSVRMGICDLMCEAYKKRYGVPFVPFLNAIDVSGWNREIKKDRSTRGPFRIMYHGSIYHGSRLGYICSQINELIDICQVVEDLNSNGLDIELIIHTPPSVAHYYHRHFKRFSRVVVDSNFIPVDEIPRFLSEKDLLILPITFNKKGASLLRYSMSTKVPEFMMSGSPVLLYGPDNVAPIQYAIKEGWGYTVTERNIDILEGAIKKLVQDTKLRQRLSERAQEIARLNHDSQKISREFQEIFIRTIR